MEQDKIGKFIAKLRREKKLTQQQLADKLGVTNRAISKWETGRGMPDLSLIKPLCDELNISINELLSGDYVKEEVYQNKLEENILNTIDYSNKKISRNKRKFIIILSLVLIIFSLIITMYIIDINRMRNNKPVIFSTWGFDYVVPIDLYEEEIKIAINEFLVDKNDLQSKHYNNEKWFVSFKTYLIEEKEKNNLYVIYAWVLEESYYLKYGKPVLDSGASIPYKFNVEKKNNKYIVNRYQIPRDGSLYEQDMKTIFPDSVLKQMDLVFHNGTIQKLKLEIQNQVKLYFHL